MFLSLKCPHCGCVLSVPSSEGLESKKATCPQCKTSCIVSDFLPKLCLKVDGLNYQLHFGSQWVGRQKAGNDAKVQIPDETRYMSKKHAVIELRCTAQGLECTFEEHGKNPTTKEGIELIEGDIVYLNVNDCLSMGGRQMYLADEFE